MHRDNVENAVEANSYSLSFIKDVVVEVKVIDRKLSVVSKVLYCFYG